MLVLLCVFVGSAIGIEVCLFITLEIIWPVISLLYIWLNWAPGIFCILLDIIFLILGFRDVSKQRSLLPRDTLNSNAKNLIF